MTASNQEARTTERLAFDERPTDDLLAELEADGIPKSIGKCADAAMRDGRPDVSDTPIDEQDDAYRDNYHDIMRVLIDRGEV